MRAAEDKAAAEVAAIANHEVEARPAATKATAEGRERLSDGGGTGAGGSGNKQKQRRSRQLPRKRGRRL